MKTRIMTLLTFAFYSYLSADNYPNSSAPSIEPQTEIEHLTLIMAKYGNNPRDLSAMNYAVLQNDEEAFDLLVKYGASPGCKTLYCASQTGNLVLFKKIIDMGVGVSSDCDLEWPIMNTAIYARYNDIVMYLLENRKRFGFDYLQHKDYVLKICSAAGNTEMYNLIASMEPISD